MLNNKIIIALAFLIIAQSIRLTQLGLTRAPEDFEFNEDFKNLNIKTPLYFFGPEEIDSQSTNYYFGIKEDLLKNEVDATIKNVDECINEVVGAEIATTWYDDVGVIEASLTSDELQKINDSTSKCVQLNGKDYTLAEVIKAITADHAVSIPENEDLQYLSDDATAGSWNIDRINQKNLPLDGNQKPNLVFENEIHVYVLDTGIEKSHSLLVDSMTTDHYTGFGGTKGNASDTSYDANGHGTHVAGTICAKHYGYFSKCQLHAVKVLSDYGGGTYSGVMKGLDWVIKNDKTHNKTSVINMSLGGRKSIAINEACGKAYLANISVVVSAGNSNKDAKDYSPASSESAITVGSSDKSDKKSSFSNWGSFVNIWAGGSQVTSCALNNKVSTVSGTSMAAPTVAGVVAALHSLFPEDSPEDIKKKLYCMAQKDKIGKAQNLLSDIKGDCWGNSNGGCENDDCSQYAKLCDDQCEKQGKDVTSDQSSCWVSWLKPICTRCICTNGIDVTGQIKSCENKCRYSFLS